jgi:hypothetical protein
LSGYGSLYNPETVTGDVIKAQNKASRYLEQTNENMKTLGSVNLRKALTQLKNAKRKLSPAFSLESLNKVNRAINKIAKELNSRI